MLLSSLRRRLTLATEIAQSTSGTCDRQPCVASPRGRPRTGRPRPGPSARWRGTPRRTAAPSPSRRPAWSAARPARRRRPARPHRSRRRARTGRGSCGGMMLANTFGATKCSVPVTVSRPASRYGDARRTCPTGPVASVGATSTATGPGMMAGVRLPVMPPVGPMLAKSVKAIPDRRLPLRAEVGRLPLHRVPRRRRGRARPAAARSR